MWHRWQLAPRVRITAFEGCGNAHAFSNARGRFTSMCERAAITTIQNQQLPLRTAIVHRLSYKFSGNPVAARILISVSFAAKYKCPTSLRTHAEKYNSNKSSRLRSAKKRASSGVSCLRLHSIKPAHRQRPRVLVALSKLLRVLARRGQFCETRILIFRIRDDEGEF